MRKNVIKCLSIVPALLASMLSVTTVGQVYVEDFESSPIGDTLSSAGFVYNLSGNQIQQSGANGSKGFSVDRNSLSGASVLRLPVSFGIDKVGDQLRYSVDARATVASAFDHLFSLMLTTNDSGGAPLLQSQFRTDGSGADYNTAQLYQNLNPSAFFEFGTPIAASALGPGFGTTEYFRFQTEIIKNGPGDYSFYTSVIDIENGDLVSFKQTESIDLDLLFDGVSDLHVLLLTPFPFTNPTPNTLEFDNFRFEVISIGDVDLNGVVDFSDISPFIGVLSAGNFQYEADCNQDGYVDFSDISAFIAILSGA